jgi:hypothetical protein
MARLKLSSTSSSKLQAGSWHNTLTTIKDSLEDLGPIFKEFLPILVFVKIRCLVSGGSLVGVCHMVAKKRTEK